MCLLDSSLFGETVSVELSKFQRSESGTRIYKDAGLEIRIFESEENLARADFWYVGEHWACWLGVEVKGDRAEVFIPTPRVMIDRCGAGLVSYFLGARKDEKYYSCGIWQTREAAELNAKRWEDMKFEVQIQECPAPLVCWWNN